ncbi:hypothetical protein HanRHA438_Chr12g0534931 [Helianthus annuus]|nr:hypothetical protein HanRHA438_Chr12g0534931 [Helianthus annuus]
MQTLTTKVIARTPKAVTFANIPFLSMAAKLGNKLAIMFDAGPSVEERAILYLEAQDRVTKGASLKWL